MSFTIIFLYVIFYIAIAPQCQLSGTVSEQSISSIIEKVLFLRLFKDTTWLRLQSCQFRLAVKVGLPLEVPTTRHSIRLLKRQGLPHLRQPTAFPLSLNFFRIYWIRTPANLKYLGDFILPYPTVGKLNV